MFRSNVAIFALLLFGIIAPPIAAEDTVLISASTDGNAGNLLSGFPALSGDGRFVTFSSDATDLVAGDNNGVRDIFLRDRDPDEDGIFDEGNAVTEIISLNSDEEQTDAGAHFSSITPSGRYVAFTLSYNDTQLGRGGVFVRDRILGTTILIGTDASGNVVNGTMSAELADISDDGRFVTFDHLSPNLVPDDTNGTWDIFVRDRDVLGNGYDGPDIAVVRVSVSTSGTEGDNLSVNPRISADGRHVVFWGAATNLVPDDTNGVEDVFVRDRDTDADGVFDEPGAVATVRVSIRSDGGEADGQSVTPMLSGDGRFVVFRSNASNLVDGASGGNIFLHDRDPDENGVFDEGNGTTEVISVGLCGAAASAVGFPYITADGALRCVVTLQPSAMSVSGSGGSWPVAR